MPHPLSVIIISGFLGAGKTTFIRHLLSVVPGLGLRIALIVNEFGEGDVDTYLLENYGAELIVSITGGCACCNGQDELVETLQEIVERPAVKRPDAVLIEASGAADPVALIDAATALPILHQVQIAALASVVDAARMDQLDGPLGPVLKSQVRFADPIILNKVDAARGAGLAVARLRALHPAARILPAGYGQIDAAAFWQSALGASKVLLPANAPQVHFACQSVLCPLPHPVSREKLEKALEQLPARVFRAKGFVRLRGEDVLQLLQYTASGNYRDYHFAPFYMMPGAAEPPCALVILGNSLDEETLQKYFSPFALGCNW